MLFNLLLALLLLISTPTIHHHHLVGADTLTRLWCECSGRDIFGTVSEYRYHSDRLKADFHLGRTCGTAPEAEGIRQHCDGMAFRLPKLCKKFAGTKHEVCYDRNFWTTDTVSLDGRTTVLKHHNYKQQVLNDCTQTCRQYWPDAVRMSAHCNYTAAGVTVPLSKNFCEFDTFTKLPKL
jgi:hypothetical protein